MAQPVLDPGAATPDPDLDPAGRFAPYGDLVEPGAGGSRQGIYSVAFTAAVAPLLGGLGLTGALLLPLAGALMVVAGVDRLLRRLGYRGSTCVIGAGFAALATPVLFYAGQLAGHTLAAGLVALALSEAATAPGESLAPARAARAALLVAAAATVRPEGYCAVAALGLVVVAAPGSRRGRAVASAAYLVAALAILGAYWLVNLWLSGQWDPLVAHNLHHHASARGARVMLFGEGDPAQVWWWLPGAGLVLALALTPPGGRARGPGGARVWQHAAAALLLIAGALAGLTLAGGRTLSGLLLVTPLAGYGLVVGPFHPRLGRVWLFATAFALQVLLMDRSGTAGGLQLGARLLMPCVPPLVALAAARFEDDRAATRAMPRLRRALGLAPVLALAAITLVTLGWGLAGARHIAAGGAAATRHALACPGRVVVARRPWESQVLAPVVLSGKQLLVVSGPVRRVLAPLAAAGVRDLALVSPATLNLRLPGGMWAHTRERWPGWLTVQHVVLSRSPAKVAQP